MPCKWLEFGADPSNNWVSILEVCRRDRGSSQWNVLYILWTVLYIIEKIYIFCVKAKFVGCALHCSAHDCSWCIIVPAGLWYKPSVKTNSLKSERGESLTPITECTLWAYSLMSSSFCTDGSKWSVKQTWSVRKCCNSNARCGHASVCNKKGKRCFCAVLELQQRCSFEIWWHLPG